MNYSWAICLAHEDAATLGPLRLCSDIEVGESGNWVWLRGQHSDESLEGLLTALPAVSRYEWLPSNQLRLKGRRIPSERLPDLSWQKLETWLRVELNPAALPGGAPAQAPLRLVRSTDESEPELLQTGLQDFREFALRAAEVRLIRLQFAAQANGEVLVRGRPLPPLPGKRFVLHGCVAVPAGLSWQPAVGTDVLAKCFRASGEMLVLWNEDGTLTRLHGEQFVPATRSAAIATEQAVLQSP